MIEEIDFQDTDNKVTIKIDNETEEFAIKKINRLQTYIDLQQSLNTALENNIQLQALLYYVKKNKEAEKLNIDGTVTVTISDNDNIYYSENHVFSKGVIQASIPNTLPIGSYTMDIEYVGSKYFEPSTLSVYFNIEKRLGKCTFEKERYYGDFNEVININGVLKDSERDTIISNCSITYDFNGETYNRETDNDGNFSLPITIPKPNAEHCVFSYEDFIFQTTIIEFGEEYEESYDEEFKDEDGNIRRRSDNIEDSIVPSNEEEDTTTSNETTTIIPDEQGALEDIENTSKNIYESYPNASYIVDVYIDNESYYLSKTQIEIVANKAPTSITINSVNTDTSSNTLTIYGSVLATYDNADNDVTYGRVSINLPDFNYKHPPVSINDNNTFTANINLIDVYSVYNTSDIENIVPYDVTSTMYTGVELEGSNVEVGEMLTVTGTVTSTVDKGKISEGALMFMLLDEEDNLIYRYVTELDATGVGIFNFNTSKQATYKVQAKYIGIFGYQDSQSKTLTVEVQ